MMSVRRRKNQGTWCDCPRFPGSAPPWPVSVGFNFVPSVFKSLLGLSGRRFWIDLRSWRFCRGAGSGPSQEEHGTPADFLIEFRTAFLECKPDPFHSVFGGHFAEGAVHL